MIIEEYSHVNVCSKIYSSILNQRISRWIKRNDTVGEEQAGFRRDHSTIDHIFTLVAIIQKQLQHHKKLYLAFINFNKSFDSVTRDKL